MIFARGQRHDFDDWEAAGNPGWGWDDVLPYFKSFETFDRRRERRGAGRTGQLRVIDMAAQVHPLCETCLRRPNRRATQRTPDYNGAQQEGVGVYQITTRGGLRESAATAFLQPGDAAAEPQRRHRRVRDAHPVRGPQGRRRRVSAPAARRRRARRPRSDRRRPAPSTRRRCCSIRASAPAALLQELGIAGRARPARRRREPAGPSRRRLSLPLAAADAELAAAGLVGAGLARRALPALPRRSAVAQRQPGRRFRALASRTASRSTCSSISRRSATASRRPACAG